MTVREIRGIFFWNWNAVRLRLTHYPVYGVLRALEWQQQVEPDSSGGGVFRLMYGGEHLATCQLTPVGRDPIQYLEEVTFIAPVIPDELLGKRVPSVRLRDGAVVTFHPLPWKLGKRGASK